MAAAGSAVAIIVSVELTLSDGCADRDQGRGRRIKHRHNQLYHGCDRVMGSHEDDSRLADFVKSRFYAHFERRTGDGQSNRSVVYFDVESPGGVAFTRRSTAA